MRHPAKNLYSVYSNFSKVQFSAIRPFTKCLNFFKMVYLFLMIQFRSIMLGGANASVCALCQYETPTKTCTQRDLAFSKVQFSDIKPFSKCLKLL